MISWVDGEELRLVPSLEGTACEEEEEEELEEEDCGGFLVLRTNPLVGIARGNDN